MQAPLFAALLRPNASLSPRGRRVLIGVAAMLAAIPGVVFYILGAWPVVGLMGLDILLLWWALTASARRDRASEQVTLWPHLLELRRTSPAGRVSAEKFDPFFVRLIVDRDAADRVSRLNFRSPVREIEVGKFLGAPDKASFANAFAPALHRARS